MKKRGANYATFVSVFILKFFFETRDSKIVEEEEPSPLPQTPPACVGIRAFKGTRLPHPGGPSASISRTLSVQKGVYLWFPPLPPRIHPR